MGTTTLTTLGLAIALAAGSSDIAAAATIVILPNVRFSGDYAIAYWNGAEYVQPHPMVTGPSGLLSGGGSVSAAYASYGSALAPNPNIDVFASDVSFPSPLLITASAFVHLRMQYFFEVVGPAGFANVLLDANAKGLTSGFGQAGFYVTCKGCSSLAANIASPVTNGDWTLDDAPFEVTSNTIYEVDLSAQANPTFGDGTGTTFSGSASVDPYFQIDPSFADAASYSLAFSPGVLDVAPGSAPEPSTWAMMLIGFAGLGYAGYRSSRTSGRSVLTFMGYDATLNQLDISNANTPGITEPGNTDIAPATYREVAQVDTDRT